MVAVYLGGTIKPRLNCWRININVLLTMIERMTRKYRMIRVPRRDPNGVMAALSAVRSQYKEHWNDVLKTIATDNDSEFATLSDLEGLSKTLIYFAHPYTSCEKGSMERHNGLIRRFIPKGNESAATPTNSLLRLRSDAMAFHGSRSATAPRTSSSRMNWIGFTPVLPDRLFNCQCSTCYCNLRII